MRRSILTQVARENKSLRIIEEWTEARSFFSLSLLYYVNRSERRFASTFFLGAVEHFAHFWRLHTQFYNGPFLLTFALFPLAQLRLVFGLVPSV